MSGRLRWIVPSNGEDRALSPPTSRGRAQRSDPEPLSDPAQFEAAFQRAFSIVAFIANRHLVDHMMRASRAFDVDF